MDGTTDETTDSEDDLDIARSVRKDLAGEKLGKGKFTEDFISRSREQSTSKLVQSDEEKLLWSDEDVGSAQPAKRRKVHQQRREPTTTPRGRSNAKNTLVGRRKRPGNGNGKAETRTREWGDASDDDQGMEYTLPTYLQQRRARFDKRMEKMKEIGLKLPPSYDDVDFSDDERLESLPEKPEFDNGQPVAPYKDKQLPKSLGLIPAPIAQWLRDYQVEGTAFLHTLFVYQTGGILGDDMGLGKTVQVIAFLTAAFGKTGDERDAKRMRKMRRANVAWYPKVLIICPGTLIENWKDELRRWGWWHIDVYHGDASAREAALQAAANGRLEILITTYATYRINRSVINLVEWDCVIADECHQIKGRTSETTLAMNEVNALCRIGLTGTAIQNSYDELWALLNWTNPGKFGPMSTWKASISEPLRAGQSHDATNYQLSKARKTAKALVQNLLPQFFLRRMKTLIADQLPKKSDRVVFCPLTETQAEAYENCIDDETIRFIKESADPCRCGSGKKKGWCCQQNLTSGSKWQSLVFPSIYHLQRLSNHLATLIPQSSDPKEKQDRDLETLQVAMPDRWRELYRSRDSILNYSNPEFCGKWKILKKLLRFWHMNGDKVLVFSHSVRLLKMLQSLFHHTTYNVSYLDGSMPYIDRTNVVSDFNSDPDQFVFLISTKAGGVGLNITSANKVVVVDPNWNPAYDLQAQDRAYRIGQVRDVEVFRLISAGTIEEIVYARQIYKQQQANIGYTASTERRYFKGVQENKDQKGEIFGLANLFNYQGENLVLRDIVNKTNVAESKAGVSIAGIDVDDSNSSMSSSGTLIGSRSNRNSGLHPEASSLMDPDHDPTESRAMSQLAALIVDEAEEADDPSQQPNADLAKFKSKSAQSTGKANENSHLERDQKHKVEARSNPILAILSAAGVEYTHENSEVIGPSKVESHLSRRAQETSLDDSQGDQHAFSAVEATCSPARTDHPPRNQQPQHGPMAPPSAPNAHRGPTGAQDVQGHKYKYHPPLSIRKRHLCSLATHHGFDDITAFSCVVESWTPEQRRRCLDRFYMHRRRLLDQEYDGVDGRSRDERERPGDGIEGAGGRYPGQTVEDNAGTGDADGDGGGNVKADRGGEGSIPASTTTTTHDPIPTQHPQHAPLDSVPWEL